MSIKKYCSYCGSKLETDSKYCESCGKEINEQKTDSNQYSDKPKKRSIRNIIMYVLTGLICLTGLSNLGGRFQHSSGVTLLFDILGDVLIVPILLMCVGFLIYYIFDILIYKKSNVSLWLVIPGAFMVVSFIAIIIFIPSKNNNTSASSFSNISTPITKHQLTNVPSEKWTLCFYNQGTLLTCNKEIYKSLVSCQTSGNNTTLYGNTYLCGKNCSIDLSYCPIVCNSVNNCINE